MPLRKEEIPIKEFQKDLLHEVNMFAQAMKERGLGKRSGKEWYFLFKEWVEPEKTQDYVRSIRPNCKWCDRPTLIGAIIHNSEGGRYISCCACGAHNYLGEGKDTFKITKCVFFESKEVYNERKTT
jgi:hypothetical protein